MPSAPFATFVGLTLLLSIPAVAAPPHAAQIVPIPRERPSNIPARSPAVNVPGTISGPHGKTAIRQASVHPKRAKKSAVRVVVIKPPMPAKVAGTRQRLASERPRIELMPGIVSPAYSVSAVPQSPVFAEPVPSEPVPQIAVLQPNDRAVPVSHTPVVQTRTNQTSINSDLMIQPMVEHTRI